MASLNRFRTWAASFTGRGSVIFLHHDAIALGLQIPGMLAAGVLLIGHQHLVAGLHVDAIGNVAIRFRGVAQQGNLIALAADEGGQWVAKLVPGGVSPDWIVFWVLLIHSLGGVIAVEDGAQHGRGARSYGAVVQVNLVLGDKELFADFRPIGVFVLARAASGREAAESFRTALAGFPGRCSKARTKRRVPWQRRRGSDDGRA